MSSSAKTELKVYTVDAFSSQPFAGNPAAVCPLQYGMNVDDTTLQNIATEISRTTAFIRPLTPKDDHRAGHRFGLRWFSPKNEIKLCGHATLASAAVLSCEMGNQSEEITFETMGGDLIVKRDGDSFAMDFPLGITENKKPSEYEAVIKSLGEIPAVQDVRWCPSISSLLLRLKDGWTRSEFENWRPDLGQLESSITGVVIVMVTTRGGAGQGYVDSEGKTYDFVSRCFVPWLGIPEDPVTGSAQTVLANYWSQELGKQEFHTRQCSPRGGEMDITVKGSRVCLRGKATLVMRGILKI